jgi:hypothetical protein
VAWSVFAAGGNARHHVSHVILGDQTYHDPLASEVADGLVCGGSHGGQVLRILVGKRCGRRKWVSVLKEIEGKSSDEFKNKKSTKGQGKQATGPSFPDLKYPRRSPTRLVGNFHKMQRRVAQSPSASAHLALGGRGTPSMLQAASGTDGGCGSERLRFQQASGDPKHDAVTPGPCGDVPRLSGGPLGRLICSPRSILVSVSASTHVSIPRRNPSDQQNEKRMILPIGSDPVSR